MYLTPLLQNDISSRFVLGGGRGGESYTNVLEISDGSWEKSFSVLVYTNNMTCHHVQIL